MNQSQLTDAVQSKLSGASRRDADQAVRAVLSAIQDAVAQGEKVMITGFGIFEKIVKPARTARNPQTGANVQVPERAQARFRAGLALNTAVKQAHEDAKLPS